MAVQPRLHRPAHLGALVHRNPTLTRHRITDIHLDSQDGPPGTAYPGRFNQLQAHPLQEGLQFALEIWKGNGHGLSLPSGPTRDTGNKKAGAASTPTHKMAAQRAAPTGEKIADRPRCYKADPRALSVGCFGSSPCSQGTSHSSITGSVLAPAVNLAIPLPWPLWVPKVSLSSPARKRVLSRSWKLESREGSFARAV